MRIGKIASAAEYRMDEKFQNLLIWNFDSFQIEKFLEICFVIFQVVRFWKFVNFPV